MSRTLSTNARRALFASETSACFLALLEFTSDELTEPIYVVNNYENITHNGQVYTAVGFSFTLPTEEDGTVSNASLSLDNVDRSFTAAIRTIRQPLNVRAKVIEASNPDDIEIGPFDFQLRDVSYNSTTITGTLYYLNYVTKNAGTIKFSNQNFPGLYVG